MTNRSEQNCPADEVRDVPAVQYKQGDRVMCNGYEGAIIRP